MFSFLLRIILIGWILSVIFKFFKSIPRQPRESDNEVSDKTPSQSHMSYTGPIEDADFEEIKSSEKR
jgi:hypothetical protein